MFNAVETDLYCRISQDDRSEGLGVGRQETDCRSYADRHDWTVGEVHVDNDISASRYSKKKRPGFDALMARLTNGGANRVPGKSSRA